MGRTPTTRTKDDDQKSAEAEICSSENQPPAAHLVPISETPSVFIRCVSQQNREQAGRAEPGRVESSRAEPLGAEG